MKPLLFLFSVLIAAGGCFTFVYIKPTAQRAEHQKSTSFQIGLEQQTSIGLPMVVEEDLFFYEGMIATSEYHQPSQMGVAYPVIKKDTMFKLVGKLGNGDDVFRAVDEEMANVSYSGYITGQKNEMEYCIAVNPEGAAYGVTACTIEYVMKWPEPVHLLKKEKVFQKGSFKAELIYGGKSKDVIKLSYREFNKDMARPAFTQEISYDLSESKRIAFKKMEIDVLEATNSHIKFIVYSPMH